MTVLIPALIGAALLNHLLLSTEAEQRERQLQTLGISCVALLSLSTPALWSAAELLQALNVRYLALLLGIFVIAAVSQCICLAIRAYWPHRQDERLWPRLVANGIAALILAEHANSLAQSVMLGLSAGLGLWLLLQLINDWQIRVESCALPAALRGTPILLIGAGLMSLALLGLNGMGAV